jgi:hypothetical protein
MLIDHEDKAVAIGDFQSMMVPGLRSQRRLSRGRARALIGKLVSLEDSFRLGAVTILNQMTSGRSGRGLRL